MVVNQEHIDEKALPALLENFSLLREKALAYVQQTSSGTWTDHNIHDPGITILEALCYALSDVGYRMNFPMQDLITGDSGNFPAHSFYYAQDILPCHPVTINDFRKILIDLPLIKNAWITPLTGPGTGIQLDYEPMYVYQEGSRLVLKKDVTDPPIPLAHHAGILNSPPVFIIGLYAIHIEFEAQPVLGHIDSGEAFEGVYEKDFFGDIFYDISNWNALINNKNVLQKIANVYTANSNDISLNILPSPKNKYNNNDGKLDERVLKEWYYNIEVLCKGILTFTFKDVLFEPFLENKKGIAGKDLKDLLTKNNFAFFGTCFKKIQALAKAYADIQTVLHQNRNLAEDYLPQLSAIPTIDFRICADIDVDTKVDIEEAQAMIFHKITEYISPSIPFYTFEELAAKGKAMEEILEGPKLTHGFVLEEEMGENSFQNFTINLSDIINAIYETEGLINCRNVELFLADDDGNTITNINKWVITVPAGYKPVLNKRKSKLTFYKNGLPLLANFKESMVKLTFLQINSVKYSHSNVPFPALNPTYRDLALHYSLADEFPATYKIGKNFPDAFLDKPALFKYKQLEGYLLLFEQLIANFLKDLHQLKESLSWDTVQHMQYKSTENDWRRNYLLTASGDSRWQDIVEPAGDFLKKRNASLDYLLSRFAENLQEIDNYFYLSTDNLGLHETDYYTYLIELKQKFLANYIAISANRGAAVNLYADPSYFKTPVSGYENRLSRLLGCELMKNDSRKTVADIDSTDKKERGYFHVLEHILLRIPTLSNEFLIYVQANNIDLATELLGICTDDDCTACGGSDPYSFTASVVLPSWIPVYADVHYREFIEKLIRKETPVGVMLRICWINKESMTNYETAIGAWWEARYELLHADADTYFTRLVTYLQKQNELVLVLKAQRSDYFPATLHGCEDEGEENNTRVFLDKTILG
jgi:hypothetical protein